MTCQYRRVTLKGIIHKKAEHVCLNSSTTYFWDMNGKHRKLENPDCTIPDWCRLEDAMPNLKEMQYQYRYGKWRHEYINQSKM